MKSTNMKPYIKYLIAAVAVIAAALFLANAYKYKNKVR
jgi:hypothetical protein